MITINPYLHFDGNCLEAFTFYQKAFGGEFHMLSRYKDMPGADPNALGGDRILHVAIPISENLHLQGSDFPEVMEGKPIIGNNFSVVINTTTEEESIRLFEMLSEGGNLIMPLGPTFWAPLFGMCDDKFGIGWMISQNPSA